MWKILAFLLVMTMFYVVVTKYSSEDTATALEHGTNTPMSGAAKSDEATVLNHADDAALVAKTSNATPLTCHALLKSIQENEDIYQQMLVAFDQAMYEALGNDKASKESIIQDAGISLDSYRQKTFAYDIELNTLTPIDGTSKKSTHFAPLLAKMINSKNYKGITELAGSQHITSRSLFFNKSVLAAIIIANKDISSTEFSLLIESGLSPNFADFVTMTRYHLSATHIETAIYYVKDTQVLHKKWYQANYEHNLTLAAAKHFNFAAFELWYGLGVPADLENGNYTAMDLIATPKNRNERQQAIRIFTALAQDNIYPYAVHSLEKISQWLPATVEQQFREYFAKQLPVLTAWQQQQSIALAAKSQEIQAKHSELIQAHAACEPQSRYDTHDLNAVHPGNIALFEYNSVEELLAYFKAREPLDDNANAQIMAALTKDEDIDFRKIFPELTAAESLNLQILMALRQNKSYDALLSLLNEGAELPENAIFLLTANNNIKLIKQLRQHKLNIHAQDQAGNTALHYALRTGSTDEMFDYLIHEGINITQGADLLREAIQAFNTRGNTAYFISQLVLNGAVLSVAYCIDLEKITPLDKEKYVIVEKYLCRQ
jgi:hypothetical protein